MKTKQRVVGAMVLIALAVIFVPYFFAGKNASDPRDVTINAAIPAEPKQQTVHSEFTVSDGKLVKSETFHDQTLAATQNLTPATAKTAVSPSKKQNTPQGSAWVVQVASFSNNQNALQLERQLRQKGFAAFSKQSTNGDNGQITRVYVGPEIKRESAQQLLSELKTDFSLKGVIVSYDPLKQ